MCSAGIGNVVVVHPLSSLLVPLSHALSLIATVNAMLPVNFITIEKRQH